MEHYEEFTNLIRYSTNLLNTTNYYINTNVFIQLGAKMDYINNLTGAERLQLIENIEVVVNSNTHLLLAYQQFNPDFWDIVGNILYNNVLMLYYNRLED